MKINNVNLNTYFKKDLYEKFKIKQNTLGNNTSPQTITPKKRNLKPLYYTLGALGAFTLGIYAHKFLGKKPLKTKEIIKPDTIAKINENISTYKQDLIKGIEKKFGIKVEAQALSCIPERNEFEKIITSLSEENYILSPKNISNGIYLADLHSHSNISDGKANPLDILEQARKYSDEVFKKTGKKFTFALSDHDSVDGVIEIMGQIAQKPQQYTNLNFVPAIELSFSHIADKSINKTETSEILGYCINPFDEKLEAYIKNLHSKRNTTIHSAIEEFQKKFPNIKFSSSEFSRIYGINLEKDMYRTNLHWQVAHYGQTKLAISNLANQKGCEPNAYYEQIMQKTGKNKALGNLKDSYLIPSHIQENDEISKIRERMQPVIQTNGAIKAPAESTSEEIFEAFENQDCIFSFAHPYYFNERLHSPLYLFKSIIAESKGKLKMSEGYHQAYSSLIDKNEIKRQNQMFETLGLKLIGGQDNHKLNLFS